MYWQKIDIDTAENKPSKIWQNLPIFRHIVVNLGANLGEPTRYYADKKDKAPVIDCVKAGYFKVLGTGKIPAQPVIVKARYFSKKAEQKIKEAGGACILTA